MAYGNVRFTASLIKTKRIMKKLLLFILLFAGLTGFKHGNNRTITGNVCSKDGGLPLPGVSIIASGIQTGTVTNEVKAWQTHQNNKQAKIKWQFTCDDARVKLLKLYPSINE